MDKVQNYEQRILRSLRRITRAVDIYSRRLNLEFGLTTPQMLCLDILSKSNDMILKDLAQTINLGESTVNGIIDRLEAKKYVIRVRSEKDRRKVYLKISPEGKDILKRTPLPLENKVSDSLLLLPGSEQINILDSLERITELIEVHIENICNNNKRITEDS
jgi:MarR family transcriptional regulator, organic hydroperoxide resistance regulator